MEQPILRPGRASLLSPQALPPEEAAEVPAPPPLESRPRNASYQNLAAKLDAIEQLAKSAEDQMTIGDGHYATNTGTLGKKNRASVLSKQEVDSGVFVPLPPTSPRPENADQFNQEQEAHLRDQLLRGQERGPLDSAMSSHDESPEQDNIIFPLPKHSFNALLERHKATKRNFQSLTLDRLATQMEDVIFSVDSVKRAVAWKPQSRDIIVASAPRCGQSLVVLMVRLLCAENDEQFQEILRVPARTPPWVECALVDEDPRVLDRAQPGTNRIFRTTMSHSMLSMKMDMAPEAKFIAVFRNPLDLRIAWFDHLKNFFAEHQATIDPGRSVRAWAEYFDKEHSPDDIADTPITMVQNTFHAQDHSKEYEYNVREWIQDMERSKRKDQCLVLFLEEILSSPEQALMKIAKFIGRDDLPQSMFDQILDETTGSKILKISKRNSQLLTPYQEALIRVKFGHEEETGPNGESSRTLIDPADRRIGFLKQLEASSQNISSRGIFSEVARNLDAQSIRRSELTEELALGHQAELSNRAIELIRQRWADTFASRAPLYEDLYERIVGANYPALRSTAVVSGRRTVAGKIFATNSSGGAERTARRTMLRKIFGSSEDSSKPENDSDGSPPANRRTLRMKLFGQGKN